MKAVRFSHWVHRIKYTCRVCHLELDFAMAVNETGITEDDNLNGLYCGACHDGKRAFGHTKENCSRCHTGDIRSDEKSFREFSSRMPKTDYGNGIDWSMALKRGFIDPRSSLTPGVEPMRFGKFLKLEAEWSMVPPAYFPHREHEAWLDCANCHPDIFNVKKKTTKHFSMRYILEKKFCGVCHMNVAFPLDDCRRCHPEINGGRR